MGIKERIEAMSDEWLEGNPHWDDGYERARSQAAQLAAEADALMAEMVSVLAGLDPSQLTDDQALNLTGVLDRYNQYKDQTND